MKFRAIYLKNIKNTVAIACLCALIATVGIIEDKRTINTMLPVENKVVIIDAGHGGFDPGKTGKNGDNEKNINLKISSYLQQYLEQSGAVVIVTRNTDSALGDSKREDMSERRRISNESDGDILISIHLQQSLIDTLDKNNKRQAKANSDHYVLKTTEIPSAIVECGFLSNAEEEAKLNTDEYQQQTAWAIYKGIVNYFNEV